MVLFVVLGLEPWVKALSAIYWRHSSVDIVHPAGGVVEASKLICFCQVKAWSAPPRTDGQW